MAQSTAQTLQSKMSKNFFSERRIMTIQLQYSANNQKRSSSKLFQLKSTQNPLKKHDETHQQLVAKQKILRWKAVLAF